jgi:negative regulator of sigma-B (phosphoserine phosphatase)
MSEAIGAAPGPQVIEWAWAGSALEVESGDLHVVVPFPGGVVVALLDGLGHGPEAAAAARAAVPVLEAHASDAAQDLVQRCHHALRGTRGAVMSLASLRTADSAMTWLGIGNVEAVLVRATRRDDAMVGRAGVVGYQMPPLRAMTLAIAPGDLLILATDGIRGGFSTGVAIDDAPQDIADAILDGFAKGSDDAHVVVARYLGARP